MNEESISTNKQEADILERSILYLIRLIQSNIKLILFVGLLGGIAGVAASYLVPKQYTCSVQILPEFSNPGSTGFSSLASLAGIDISQRSERDAFRPDLYPNVLTSTTAVVYLLRQPVTTIYKKKFPTLIDYFSSLSKEKSTIEPGELESKTVNPAIWRFNLEEKSVIENVRKRIKANFDKKSGIVVLDVEMPDQEIAANSISLLTQYLKDFLLDYRTQKKREQSKFLEDRAKAAKVRMTRTEYAYNNYRDRNRNVISNVSQMQEQKLQFEFAQAQAVHNDLVGQLERAKIEELQEEDVLITVESPILPLGHSSPKRLFYGIGVAVACVLLLILILSKPWKWFQ